MTFRFVHTADWQLGKPFSAGRFGPELSANLARARHDAIGRIARVAREQGAGHVVVAGDVWDASDPADRMLQQPIGAMASASDLSWWLLPGNHDPAGRGGLWDRLKARGLPANIHCLCSPLPQKVREGVYFLPAPLFSRDPGKDPTANMRGMKTPEGSLRIGVAHGSVRDFKGEGVGVISASRANEAGLAYLALGDWHGHKRVGDRTWYAGTPEPDQFPPNNEPGYVLLVEADGAATPKVTPIRTLRYHWSKTALTLSPGDDAAALFEACQEEGTERSSRLCRIEVSGRLTIEARAALEAHLKGQGEDHFAYLAYDLSGLEVASAASAFDVFAGEGTLRTAAERLAALASGTDEAMARRARRALGLMTRLAA